MSQQLPSQFLAQQILLG